MGKVLVNEESLSAIGDAIRSKKNEAPVPIYWEFVPDENTPTYTYNGKEYYEVDIPFTQVGSMVVYVNTNSFAIRKRRIIDNALSPLIDMSLGSRREADVSNNFNNHSNYWEDYYKKLYCTTSVTKITTDYILDYIQPPKYKPSEMADEIKDFITVPNSMFNLEGNCSNRFAYNVWNDLITQYGDRFKCGNISSFSLLFYYSDKLETIPFKITSSSTSSVDCNSMFSYCNSLKEIPEVSGFKIGSANILFYDCSSLKEITSEKFHPDYSYWHTSTSNFQKSQMFYGCYRLRYIDPVILSNYWGLAGTSSSYSYGSLFANCYVLDRISRLGVHRATLTSNCFSSTFNSCYRLKSLTFDLDNGQPFTANWKGQTIDLSSGIGYGSNVGQYLDDNTKQITDAATYAQYKDDADAWTGDMAYSRYNHDSAVETINSLPDTTSSGGTNTIKFKGAAGSATDGGAINTLTDAEIAVAASKGWTVTLS